MNWEFSQLSENRFTGIKASMINLARLALMRSPIDFGIAWMGGKRNNVEQYSLYKSGNSTKDGYTDKSKHQNGEALDILPYVNGYPLDGSKEWHKPYYLIIIGVFFACADELSMKIRSGSNWDRDAEFLTDQNFNDLPHIEEDV